MCNQFSCFYFQQAAPHCQPRAAEQSLPLHKTRAAKSVTQKRSQGLAGHENWIVSSCLKHGEVPQRHGLGKKVSASGNLRLLPILKESFLIFLFFSFKKKKSIEQNMHFYSLKHRMTEMLRLQGTSGGLPAQTPCSGNLQPVPEDHVQTTLEYLQRGKLPNLPG